MLASGLPSAATIPIASTKSGKAMIVSTTRPMMRSVQPPKYPAEMPSRVPMAKAGATEVAAGPAREMPGRGCGEGADGGGERDRGGGDAEIDPGGDDDPAENIAAEL